MAVLECPNGHSVVVRHDPKSTGHRAMCDRCGWEAQYVRSDSGKGDRFEEDGLGQATEDERVRRNRPKLAPAGRESQEEVRRRSDT